ncbi:hypothetical protein [Gordonia bronchialis]|uniref:hypothetical protein n=1 Tax=Gordonia bronchialis TaxID=2054 RepID=UPI002430C26C|nr:hypothetical protein [Gordonia bronchialis]
MTPKTDENPTAENPTAENPTADDSAAENPAASRGSRARTRPVRTAPMRRGGRAVGKPVRRPSPASSAPTQSDPAESETDQPASGTGVPDSGDEEWTGVDDAALPAQDGPTTVVLTKTPANPAHESGVEATTTIEPDPADVERTISYRERRRARVATGDVPRSRRVRYRGSSGRSTRRIALAVVAVIATIAFAVAAAVFAIGINRQQDLDELRSEYSSFASQFIVNMTSMNPSNVDQVLKTVQEDTSGRVKQQLQDSTQQAVGLVRDTNVETKTSILSEAVTKAEPDEGSVIMVFGWEQRSLDGKIPTQVQTFRWRVDVTRINGDLKVTNFEWVA